MYGLKPSAWLIEVLHRIPDYPNTRIDQLPSLNCKLDDTASGAACPREGWLGIRLQSVDNPRR